MQLLSLSHGPLPSSGPDKAKLKYKVWSASSRPGQHLTRKLIILKMQLTPRFEKLYRKTKNNNVTCRNTAHNNVHFCDTALPVDDVVVFFLSSLSVNAAFSAGTVCSAGRVGRKFLNTHTQKTKQIWILRRSSSLRRKRW